MTRAAAALLAAFLATGCVSPSRTDDDYARKAANTAESVGSAVNTALVGVRAARTGKVFANYLSRLLAEAEEDADAAVQTFDSVQPPNAKADAIHDELDTLLNEATDVLRELRITVRRGELARLADVAAPLDPLSTKFDAFQAEWG